VGRETLEEASKVSEVVVVSTLGGTGRWKVVVDGNERVQQGTSGKYRLEMCWRAGRVLKGDETGMVHLSARKHYTCQGGRMVSA